MNFTASTVTDNFVLGKTGEHNATQLTITPPSELSGENRTDHYRVAFYSGGKAYLSSMKTGATFVVTLPSEITRNPSLSIQIIAYDDDGEYIGKSKRIDGFRFEPSIGGTEVEINGENDDIAFEIANVKDMVLTLDSLLSAETVRANGKENQLLSGKVDKVAGKGLSTNDYTNAEKQKLASLENYDDTGVLARLTDAEGDISDLETGKVDKASGKGLSTNDYTNSEREKLALVHGRVFYATCSTAANEDTKVVSTDADFSLTAGTVIVVSFENASGGGANSARYLNVNSSGAYPIRATNSNTLLNFVPFKANSVVTFVYEDNKWIEVNLFYADSIRPGMVTIEDEGNIGYDASYGKAVSPKALALVNNAKVDKPSQISSGTNITLADNTEYRLTDVSTLTIAYPQGNFECWLKITTAASGTITITLPTSAYIGSVPTFGNGETWELSIKDGVVVAGKAVSL